jgi:hypothetical protein
VEDFSAIGPKKHAVDNIFDQKTEPNQPVIKMS